MNIGTALATALFLAALVLKFVDFFRNAFDTGNRVPKAVWQLVSFGFGVLVAFVWKVDVVSPILGHGNDAIAKFLTGLAIGAGASFLHDIVDGGTPAPTPKGLIGKTRGRMA